MLHLKALKRADVAMLWALAAGMVVALSLPLFAAEPWQLQETRYCGEPARNADGSIKRSQVVLRAFQRLHPCPSTGKRDGACPGWALNHVVPLACGGCDSVSNLDWMPVAIKSCSGPTCRDRWERSVYDIGIPNTDACTNKVLTLQ